VRSGWRTPACAGKRPRAVVSAGATSVISTAAIAARPSRLVEGDGRPRGQRRQRRGRTGPAELDRSRVPAHIACVMDGNGRWASRRASSAPKATRGEEALLDVINGGLEIGVSWMTMYAFSTENGGAPRRGAVPHGLQRVAPLAPARRAARKGRAHPLRRAPGLARAPARAAPDGRVRRAHAGRPAHDAHHGLQLRGRAEIVDAVRQLVAEASPRQGRRAAIRRHLYWPICPTPTWWCAPRGAPDLQLLALGARLQRAGVPRRALARLPPGASLRAVVEFQRRTRRYGGVDQ